MGPGSVDVPAELRQFAHFLVWRYVIRDGKCTKLPLNGASSTSRDKWLTYEQACYVAQYLIKTGKGGIGYAPDVDDPFAFIDLDGCVVEGKIDADAQAIMDALGGYWERSPSGTGMRGIVRGNLPIDSGHVAPAPWANRVPHPKAQIEAYDHGHYFTITGDGQGSIADRQPELDAFAAKYLRRQYVRSGAIDHGAWDYDGTDDELLADLRRNWRFVEVYEGRTIPAGKDGDSDADFELCCRIGELTGDPERIERIWSGSPLARRRKFERENYRRQTIERALGAAAVEVWSSSLIDTTTPPHPRDPKSSRVVVALRDDNHNTSVKPKKNRPRPQHAFPARRQRP
jgi:primase-polymerase (primpol)-like protein